MSFVADSGGLYALYDSSDTHHRAVRSIVQNETGPIIVPTAILGSTICSASFSASTLSSIFSTV